MAEERPDLKAEIWRLREEIAELGQRQAEELRALRGSLAGLEQRLIKEEKDEEEAPKAADKPVALPPPLPPVVVEKEEDPDELVVNVEDFWTGVPAPAEVGPEEETADEVVKKVEKFRTDGPLPRVVHEAKPVPEAPELSKPAPAAAWEKEEEKALGGKDSTSWSSSPQPSKKAGGSLELRMGQVWLVRIGIALLVTGLVLLGNYAYRNWIRELPAGVRLAFLYLGSFGLCGAGAWVGRREGMRRFGEVVMAGGLAFFYWCTFAAHHVERLRVIDSPKLAAVLLLVAAGVMVGVSLKRDSRGTAVLGLLLASYSTVLQPLGWLSAVSNLILAGAGVALMLRPGWAAPGIATMAGSYGAFLWWQLAGAVRGAPEDPAALWFLPPVWAVFALPGLIGRYKASLSERARAWLTGINNGVFFVLYSTLWLMQRGGGDYWRVPAVFGGVLLVLGVFGRRKDSIAGGVCLTQGLAALVFATVLKLEGHQLALGLAGEALVLAGAFYRFRGKSELAFTLIAGAAAVLVSFWDIRTGNLLAVSDAPPLWSTGLVALILAAAAAVMRAACERVEGEIQAVARVTTGIDLLGGALVAAALWCPKLADPWPAPVAALLALAAAAGLSAGREQPWLRELVAVIGMFLFSSVVLFSDEPGSTVAGVSVLLLAFIPALLVLALRRFRGMPELVASLVVMAVVGLVALIDMTRELSLPGRGLVPPWSAWMVALVFGAAGVLLRWVHDSIESGLRKTARVFVLPMLLGGSAVALGSWLIRLDPCWHEPVAMAIALALSGATLLGDRRRWIPEIGWVSMVFAAAGCLLLLDGGSAWSALAAMGLAAAACCLWHRWVPEPVSETGTLPDPAATPGIPGWLNAALVPIFLLAYWSRIELPTGAYPGYAGLAALLLVAAGVGLRCHRLAVTGSLLHGVGLVMLPNWPDEGLVLAGFETPLLALATLAFLLAPWVRPRMNLQTSVSTSVVSRGVAFFGWLLVWHHFSPQHWIDVIALSAVVVALLTVWWPRDRERGPKILQLFDFIFYSEAWGFLAIAVLAAVSKGLTGPWHEIGELANWQAWAVAPAVLGCAVLLRQGKRLPTQALAAIFLLGAVLLAAWATQMLVWRHGWVPVGVLWTLLGFGYVTTGLWQRLAVLRQAGFGLLAMALLKLFIVDVWDFDAFTRVVAFLALGVALVVLGFFYNKFAGVLKKLLEQEDES